MAALLGFVRPLWFFSAFAIGLLVCYVIQPQPEVVVRFPSPYNAGQVVYRDKADNCFTYESTEVSCSAEARPQPVA